MSHAPAESIAPASQLPNWTAAERESFFDAIARHRDAAWRVQAASLVASALVALIVALLLSPLFYAALSLLCDLANLIVPTVNLVEVLGRHLAPILDAPEKISTPQWMVLGGWAALPGLLFMAGTLFVLRRAVRLSGLLDGATFAVLPPDAQRLDEQRFRNVVAEMAVAAGIPEPRVLLADWNTENAAVFGGRDGDAVIVVARRVTTLAPCCWNRLIARSFKPWPRIWSDRSPMATWPSAYASRRRSGCSASSRVSAPHSRNARAS